MAVLKTLAAKRPLPDLLMLADDIRALEQNPGWLAIVAEIDLLRDKLIEQVVNPTAKPDEIDQLRGRIYGMQATREAAKQIVDLAVEREAEANRALARETAHA